MAIARRVVQPPLPAVSALSKKFNLVVNADDVYGEIVPKSLDITISSQEELKELRKFHGGGSLVLDDTRVAVGKG